MGEGQEQTELMMMALRRPKKSTMCPPTAEAIMAPRSIRLTTSSWEALRQAFRCGALCE